MGRHRLFQEGLSAGEGESIVIGGEEAHHAARVKRVQVGDDVEVLNGAGLVLAARLEETRRQSRGGDWEVVLRVLEARRVAPDRPRVEVWSAVPKGDRFEEMIDQLAQVGVAEWCPLHTARGVTDPREGKLQRASRRAIEASKQSGRAWAMALGDGGDLSRALRGDGASVVLADASGEAYRRSGAESVRVLVGPEGGWDEAEIGRARAAGATVARFGACVMRLETAAVVAGALVREFEGGEH